MIPFCDGFSYLLVIEQAAISLVIKYFRFRQKGVYYNTAIYFCQLDICIFQIEPTHIEQPSRVLNVAEDIGDSISTGVEISSYEITEITEQLESTWMDIKCKIILLIGVLSCTLAQSKSTDDSKLLDEWVVQLDGGLEQAAEYANTHDMELIGQVAELIAHPVSSF